MIPEHIKKARAQLLKEGFSDKVTIGMDDMPTFNDLVLRRAKAIESQRAQKSDAVKKRRKANKKASKDRRRGR
jgi:hypothetical protein